MLDEVINLYSQEKELEIRFYINDLSVYKSLYTSLFKKATAKNTEQSIDFITTMTKSKSKRIEIRFNPTRRRYIEKTKLRHVDITDLVKYRVAVSDEIEIPSFSANFSNLVRFKNRSLLLLGDWRADFTVVRTANPSDDISKIKKDFFAVNLNDFLTVVSLGNVSLEFELEYVGKPAPNVEEAVLVIFDIIDPDYKNNALYKKVFTEICYAVLGGKKAKAFSERYTLKQLVNQPKALNAEVYRNAVIPDYYVSNKADGERGLLYVGDTSYILTSGLQKLQITSEKRAILDVEYIFNDIYVFDALFVDKRITHLNYEDRFKLLETTINNVKIGADSPNVKIKPQNKIVPADLGKIYKSAKYPTDGLIFTPPGGYFDSVYKWKPQELQTIDFLVLQPPDSVYGIEPFIRLKGHNMLFLFNGISKYLFDKLNLQNPPGYEKMMKGINTSGNIFPVAFQHISNEYLYIYYAPEEIDPKEISGHVAEFKWNTELKTPTKWVLHKLRPDKDEQTKKGLGYGNSYRTAENIYDSFSSPLTLEMLIAPDKCVAYFLTGKASAYKALTKFNAFVKSRLIKQLEGANSIIDLAAGKGQDLFTIHGMGIKNALFVDIDKEALIEINRRKQLLGKQQFYLFENRPSKDFKLSTRNIDLTKLENVELPVLKGSVDGILMNFALHYIVKDEESLRNIADFIDLYLKPMGLFIFTCFDGARVFDFLQGIKTGESKDMYGEDLAEDDKSLRYSIKKSYSDKKFKPSGLKIAAIHPFSDGKYYDEYLLGIDWIIAYFRKKGYLVLQYGSFGDWLDKFANYNSRIHASLTNEDKVYSSLYSYVTLSKQN